MSVVNVTGYVEASGNKQNLSRRHDGAVLLVVSCAVGSRVRHHPSLRVLQGTSIEKPVLLLMWSANSRREHMTTAHVPCRHSLQSAMPPLLKQKCPSVQAVAPTALRVEQRGPSSPRSACKNMVEMEPCSAAFVGVCGSGIFCCLAALLLPAWRRVVSFLTS